jgi:hypothetical protein
LRNGPITLLELRAPNRGERLEARDAAQIGAELRRRRPLGDRLGRGFRRVTALLALDGNGRKFCNPKRRFPVCWRRA